MIPGHILETVPHAWNVSAVTIKLERYATSSKLSCWCPGLTIVSHCLKVDPHQIGQQEGISPWVPGAIANMKGIGCICAAPSSGEIRVWHFADNSGTTMRYSVRNVGFTGDLSRSPDLKNAPCDNEIEILTEIPNNSWSNWLYVDPVYGEIDRFTRYK